MNLDEAIARTKEASESQRLGELGRETALQLTAWLEELKQYKEENQPETNYEHFKKEILENCVWHFALVKGKPKRCNCTKCSNCEFNKDNPGDCHKEAAKWLKRPHIKTTCKLTQFEYDLLLSCSQGYSPKYQFKNINCLTEMREKGHFKGVDRDATIEDILANCEIKEED